MWGWEKYRASHSETTACLHQSHYYLPTMPPCFIFHSKKTSPTFICSSRPFHLSSSCIWCFRKRSSFFFSCFTHQRKQTSHWCVCLVHRHCTHTTRRVVCWFMGFPHHKQVTGGCQHRHKSISGNPWRQNTNLFIVKGPILITWLQTMQRLGTGGIHAYYCSMWLDSRAA